MRLTWTRLLAAGIAVGIALGVPALARAAEADPSMVATAPYELDFTLPSESRSGCMVCHGDPALVRIREGAVYSYFIDEQDIAVSTHVDQQCVACHIDFAYRAPHLAGDWVITAKSSCRNCHDQQSRDVGTGVHRPTVVPEASGETTPAPKPLCGDCHGSHDIAALTEVGGDDFKAGQRAIHLNGYEVCGRCHQDYWDSYNDYYHGAAYKLGALDAPACWDCHGWHDIQPSDNRNSRVNAAHLVETCGQDGCHIGVDENYTEYAAFIHGREQFTAENPLHALIRTITNAFSRLFGGSEA